MHTRSYPARLRTAHPPSPAGPCPKSAIVPHTHACETVEGGRWVAADRRLSRAPVAAGALIPKNDASSFLFGRRTRAALLV